LPCSQEHDHNCALNLSTSTKHAKNVNEEFKDTTPHAQQVANGNRVISVMKTQWSQSAAFSNADLLKTLNYLEF
jgi:hypothetical protein